MEIFTEYGDDLSPEEHLQQRVGGFGAYRREYVAGLLSITEHGDACEVLLCPEVRDENGDWECWKMGGWCGVGRWKNLEGWFDGVLEWYSQPSMED